VEQLAAITVAQLFGVQLGVTDYLLIAFVSLVRLDRDGEPSTAREAALAGSRS
jgi:hypothetical protein